MTQRDVVNMLTSFLQSQGATRVVHNTLRCIMHDVKVSTHVETNNNNSTLGSTPDSDILLSNKTPVYKKYFYTLKQHVETNNMLKQTTCWTTCLIVTFCYQTKLQFIRNIFIHWNNMLKQTTCWNKQHVETNNNNSTLGSTPDSDILLSSGIEIDPNEDIDSDSLASSGSFSSTSLSVDSDARSCIMHNAWCESFNPCWNKQQQQ